MTDATLPLEDHEPTFRGTLPGRNGVPLAFSRWEHPEPKGRIVLLHGYGEHGERYRHTADWLLGLGWSVSTLDQQGFGRSGGIRGDAQGIRGFVEDAAGFLRQERMHDVRRTGTEPQLVEGLPLPPVPACPQILLGHSFGGLVATLTLLWHPDTLEGLVLSSPAIHLRPLSLLARIALPVLGALAPHWSTHQPSPKDRVCTDPRLVARFASDPLCHQWITAAFGKALLEGEEELLPFGSELDRPILLLEAGDDVICDPDATESLWSEVRKDLLERHRMVGFKHELLHDLRRSEVQSLIESWLTVHFPDGGSGTPSRLAPCHYGVHR